MSTWLKFLIPSGEPARSGNVSVASKAQVQENARPNMNAILMRSTLCENANTETVSGPSFVSSSMLFSTKNRTGSRCLGARSSAGYPDEAVTHEETTVNRQLQYAS